jgi:glutamate synthase domain-containing protein 3
MSGGLAFVHDPEGLLGSTCNLASVGLEPVAVPDEPQLRGLLERHLAATGSAVAARLLDAWPVKLPEFVKVLPDDLRRLLDAEAAHSDALEAVGA